MKLIKYTVWLLLPLIVLAVGFVLVAQAGGDPRMRFMHASPDAPAADIYLDGQKIFSGVGYKAVSNYQAVTSGTHRFKVLAAGSDPNAPGVLEADLPFAEGMDYTLVAMGKLQGLEVRQFQDNNTPPEGANKSRVRFIHTSIDTPGIDVCVTGHSSCFVSNLTYKNATSYALPDSGLYSLDLRQTGSENIIKTVPNVQFNNGEVYTVFIVGLMNGSPPLELVISTDAQWQPTEPPTTGAFLSPTALMVVVTVLLLLALAAGMLGWQFFKAKAV